MSERKKKPDPEETKAAVSRCPLPEWLAVRLDVPSDILEGGMRVELRGRHMLLVQGCRRILHYAPDHIRLQMKGCVLNVTGARLLCHAFLAGALGVEGRVDCVSFEEEL